MEVKRIVQRLGPNDYLNPPEATPPSNVDSSQISVEEDFNILDVDLEFLELLGITQNYFRSG